MPDFYKSSWGDLRLWISRLSTDKSRSQVVHEASEGDGYVVQDRGRAPLRARATILFDWMVGEDLAPLERLRKFNASVDGDARFLSHPVEGSYLARIGDWKYDIDESGVITGEAEFIAVAETVAVAEVGAGGIPASGEGAVADAAAALEVELADIGESSTLPSECATAADSWAASDEPNAREIIAQTGSLTAQLGDRASTYEDDIELWPAYAATVLLSESVRSAADAATADTAQTFVMKIGTSVALRALLASVYGAAEVEAQYTRAMQLNDISNPAWLELGAEIVLALPAAPARSA